MKKRAMKKRLAKNAMFNRKKRREKNQDDEQNTLFEEDLKVHQCEPTAIDESALASEMRDVGGASPFAFKGQPKMRGRHKSELVAEKKTKRSRLA